ncbi:Rha family transcriptional regulator [Weissella viridescens]|uniref:Rha family transcriptional regulator n=1 Tax=Weissella viridescens TaxID=1629 RepID=UPI003AF30B25
MLNELHLVENHEGEAVTDSRKVAEYFGKQHKDVLRTIDQLLEEIDSVKLRHSSTMFKEVAYISEKSHRPFRMYEMNKDGFTLLAMGFTGPQALKFKLNYINRFNDMEGYIEQRHENDTLSPLYKSSGQKFNHTNPKLMMEIARETSDEVLKEQLLHEAGERLLNG